MLTCWFLDAWFLPDCCTFQFFSMQSIKAQAMQRLQSISPSYQLNVTCHNKPSDIEADQPELLWRWWHDISGWTWAVTLQDIYIISNKRWCFDFFLSFFQLFSLSMMNIAVFPLPLPFQFFFPMEFCPSVCFSDLFERKSPLISMCFTKSAWSG